MAKDILHDKYISEDERKKSLKKTTRSVCIVITVTFAYMLGYTNYLMGLNSRLSFMDALDMAEENISSFHLFYAVNASVLKGWMIGLFIGGFIYFCLSIDNERHQTTNMQRSAGTGGFMTENQRKEYDRLYKVQDPPVIVDYAHQIPKKAEWNEIKLYYSQNMIMSNSFTRPIDSRVLIGNNNVLIIGGAGSGKSRFVIKPNILQMNASYIVTDPSGEIIVSLGNVLKKNGYKILIFNLSDKMHSNTYNPIKYIKAEEDVNILVTCLIDNTTKGEGGGENQFFVDAEKLLYSACIFYLVDFCRDESKKNFSGVMDMIISSNVNEKDPDAKSRLDQLFDQLPYSSLASKYYRSFKQAAGKTLKSIIISCVTRLQPFLIPQVMNLTKTDELNLENLGDERTALFIITPQADRTYSFLASLLYSQIFRTLYAKGERQKAEGGDERLHIPVRCMMDELANIGVIPNWYSLLATMRKYNISALMALQNIAQLESMYDVDYKTIIGNCATRIFLGSSEKDDLEYFSEVLGEETIRVKSTSSSQGSHSNNSKNYQYTSRKVMMPDELANMSPDECIVFTQNFKPVRDLKYKYENHPYFDQTGDFNSANNFSYSKVSAYDNSNSNKFSSLLVAQSEIMKYKKRAKPTFENADSKVINNNETPDEVLNNVKYTREEIDSIIRTYVTYYISKMYKEMNHNIPVLTAYNMPTKYLSRVYREVSRQIGLKNIILFSSIQSKKGIMLGCVNNRLAEHVLNHESIIAKEKLNNGDWLFMIREADIPSYKAIYEDSARA